MTQDTSELPKTGKHLDVSIIRAFIAAVGFIIVALISYCGVRYTVDTPIHATMTAEVLAFTRTAQANHNTPTITITPLITATPRLTTPTEFATVTITVKVNQTTPTVTPTPNWIVGFTGIKKWLTINYLAFILGFLTLVISIFGLLMNYKKMKGKKNYFVIKKTYDNMFYVNLVAANHETILTSETFDKKSSVIDLIQSLKKESQGDSHYLRKVATNGYFYFLIVRRNDQVLGVSEQYSTTHALEDVIALVKHIAPNAPVIDLSK